MKLLSIIFLVGFISAGTKAADDKFLDGAKFVDCFEAAVNHTIQDYKAVIAKKNHTDKVPESLNESLSQDVFNTKGDANRFNALSTKAKNLIKNDFFEEYNGHLIAYDAEDIILATVGDLIESLKGKINCYNPYKASDKSNNQRMKAPFYLSKITDFRNTQLTKDALGKMLSHQISEDDLERPISDFNFKKYCKTI